MFIAFFAVLGAALFAFGAALVVRTTAKVLGANVERPDPLEKYAVIIWVVTVPSAIFGLVINSVALDAFGHGDNFISGLAYVFGSALTFVLGLIGLVVVIPNAWSASGCVLVYLSDKLADLITSVCRYLTRPKKDDSQHAFEAQRKELEQLREAFRSLKEDLAKQGLTIVLESASCAPAQKATRPGAWG